MAYCLGNRELNSPYMSLETTYERIRRIVQMIGTGDVSPLAFALWLRWHRLEFGYADDVAASDGNSHQHSGGPALAKAVRTLPVPDGAVALDLGAGMGIAALTLSHHFSRVVGVELAPALIAAAQRNLGRLNVVNVELHCADARSFIAGLDEVTHVYMFNPFPAPVMADVLVNLNQSLLRRPRQLTIIYKHPVCHATIIEAGFLHLRELSFRYSHPFAIYSNRLASVQ